LRLVFTPQAWEDYKHWQQHDRATLKRLNRVLDDTLRDPYAGVGKPEQLRHALAGAWSRRIDAEHRLVYIVDGDDVIVVQARYHYR
jgi:toxin YoeB